MIMAFSNLDRASFDRIKYDKSLMLDSSIEKSHIAHNNNNNNNLVSIYAKHIFHNFN